MEPVINSFAILSRIISIVRAAPHARLAERTENRRPKPDKHADGGKDDGLHSGILLPSCIPHALITGMFQEDPSSD